METQTKKRLPKYENKTRTTFDQVYETPLPYVGIYIIAYMGEVLYVGKAESSVFDRLNGHIERRKSRIGLWLYAMEFDWKNVRLDILEPPAYEGHDWLVKVENACIKQFNPLFNDRLIPAIAFDNYELSKALLVSST